MELRFECQEVRLIVHPDQVPRCAGCGYKNFIHCFGLKKLSTMSSLRQLPPFVSSEHRPEDSGIIFSRRSCNDLRRYLNLLLPHSPNLPVLDATISGIFFTSTSTKLSYHIPCKLFYSFDVVPLRDDPGLLLMLHI